MRHNAEPLAQSEKEENERVCKELDELNILIYYFNELIPLGLINFS